MSFLLSMIPHLDILTILDIFCGGIIVFIAYRLIAHQRYGPLPPGPNGLPILGNILHMPTSYEWSTFATWGEKWGGIISVNLLGQRVVILNSAEFASELLEKRSAIYSDRPTFMMSGELVGWNEILGLTRYNNTFRDRRKLITRKLGTRSHLREFHELKKAETRKFLQRVLKDPDNLTAHIRKTAGAIILKITYGYTVEEGSDPLVELVDRAVDQFCQITRLGAYLVDVLPVLSYLPSWLPGIGFKKEAVHLAKTMNDMTDVPLDFVKQQMKLGIDLPNFTSELLQKGDVSSKKEQDIKWAAASLYSAGFETTVSLISSFFLAMMLFPEVQRTAQEEVDRVIGNGRLPVFEDRNSLPYIEALVKEVFRFHTVAPLGLPHRLIQDDEFQGYYLPKDTIVIANIWKFLHDPDVYPNPSVFDPSRFLQSQGHIPQRDPRELVFGFGRRVCPGMHLADASIFISCVTSLAVFEISKPIENGQAVEPVYGMSEGTIRCTIKPRTTQTETLILSDE